MTLKVTMCPMLVSENQEKTIDTLESSLRRADEKLFEYRCDWEDAMASFGLPCHPETTRERIQRGRQPRQLRNQVYTIGSLPYLAKQYIDTKTQRDNIELSIVALKKEMTGQ